MPITREEKLLNTLGTGVASGVSPITREEQYLAYIAGETYTKPDAPITRKEAFLDKIPQGGGGGGGVTIKNQNKTITENGTYTADSGYTGLGTVTVDVQASGGENDLDLLVEDKLANVVSNVEQVRNGAFANSYSLRTVTLPKATMIGSSADGIGALELCRYITSVVAPNATSVGQKCFKDCNAITSLELPNVTTVGDNAFRSCNKLSKITLGEITSLGNYAFNYCGLEEFYSASLTQLSNRTFDSCKKLKKVILPNLTTNKSTSYYAWFYDCNSLVLADLGRIDNVLRDAFYNNYSLRAVVIRKTDAPSILNSTSVFYHCYHFYGTVNATYNPDGLKDGYIYVPSAIIEDYKVATNWSTFAEQFRALEDYTVDGTTTGELDESKI